MGERLQVVVLEHDRSSGRVALSTKVLETAPGQMLADKAGVQARAQENLDKYVHKTSVVCVQL